MANHRIHFFFRDHYSSDDLLDNYRNPPPTLPDRISPIPDHHCASTFNFDYYLADDGVIYARSRTPEDPKRINRGNLESVEPTPDNLGWKPFDGCGVPYDRKMKPILSKNDQIGEIAVASEFIMAVSKRDSRVYMYKPTKKTRPLYWSEKLGAPFKTNLYLPEQRRTWCFSCSVHGKDIRNVDFIHPNEVVDYFTDSKGEHFEYGFTATTYVLDSDGLKITLWDTGLPGSFSRGFIVPDCTQGQEMSAAGSIIFLSAVNSENELSFWTLKNCYERGGGCPGLVNEYKKIPPQEGDTIYPLGEGVRQLPGETWVEHDISAIRPYITSKVCIRLTGQGDEERELRIQGKDPALGEGYYYKKINESQWNFCPAPEVGPVDLEHKISHPFNLDFSQTRKMSYSEKDHRDPEITLEVQDFHPFQIEAEPFYLVVNYQGLTESIPIYSIDAWGLLNNPHYDDALVGASDGQLKALVGTLVLTPSQLELTKDEHSPLGKYLREHYLPFHEKTKSIPIVADNTRVIFKLGKQEFHFQRELSQIEKDYSFYMRRVMDPELQIDYASPEAWVELLKKNKACLEKNESIFSSRHFKDNLFELVNANLIKFHPIAERLFQFVNPADPTYIQAVKDLEILFKVHKMAIKYTIKNNPGYLEARAILKSRINDLKEMIEVAKERTIVMPFG